MAAVSRCGRRVLAYISNLKVMRLVTCMASLFLLLLLLYGLPFTENSIKTVSEAGLEEGEEGLEEASTRRSRRLQTMAAFCGERGERLSHGLSRNLIVSHQYRVLYCDIPHTGSYFWKRKLIENSARGRHFQGDEDDPDDSVLKRFGLRILSELSQKQRDYIREEYYKFALFRHPLTRIVTSFMNLNNKLTRNRKMSELGDMILQFDKGIVNPTPKPKKTHLGNDNRKVSFEQFVKFITGYHGNKVGAAVSADWETYEKLCNPCVIKYNYLGAADADDARHLLRTVFNETDEQRHLVATVELGAALELVAQLTPNTQQALVKKYDGDMRMLGLGWGGVLKV